jgi:putative ABC transport system substrate-binding protein
VRRRDFVKISAAAAILPLAAHAQQQKATPVVGILAAASAENAGAQRNVGIFRQGLAEAGFIDGQNVRFEYRWAETRFERLPALAAELVNRKVDVIATEGGDGPVLAAKQATSTIPIVGIINTASTARPGGNVTGVSLYGLAPGRIGIVSELNPGTKQVAFLANPNDPVAADNIREMQQAAGAKDMQLHVVEAGQDTQIEPAFATIAQMRPDAVMLLGNVLFSGRVAQVGGLAARLPVPTIAPGRIYVENGFLLGYGPDLAPLYQLNGNTVGKILKGANPADLPMQPPTKFLLAVNLKTAKAHGLTVPQSILARADRVIE